MSNLCQVDNPGKYRLEIQAHRFLPLLEKRARIDLSERSFGAVSPPCMEAHIEVRTFSKAHENLRL
jgi:hypothetical protein